MALLRTVLNNMIICAPPAYTYVRFSQQISLAGPVVELESNIKQINVTYSAGQLNSDISSSYFSILSAEALNLLGSYKLYPTTIINGIELIPERDGLILHQFIIDGSRLATSRIIVEGSDVYILLSTLGTITINSYVSLINGTLTCPFHALIDDASKFRVANIKLLFLNKSLD